MISNKRTLAGVLSVSLLGIGLVSTYAFIANAQQTNGTETGISIPATIDVTINSMRFGAIPLKTTPIQVRVLDDSPANLRLRTWMEQSLVKRGYFLGDDTAPLVMTLDTSEGTASPLPAPNRTLPILLYGQKGGMQGEDDVSVGLRLYSTNEASVVGGRASPGTPVVGNPGTRLLSALTERASGRQVWVGWSAMGESTLPDGDKLLVMADPLAAAVGQANQSKTVRINSGRLNMP